MPISRQKSCLACRAAKARCSRDQNCSRCVERGLVCDYGHHFSRPSPYSRPPEQVIGTGHSGPKNVDPSPEHNDTSPPVFGRDADQEPWQNAEWLSSDQLGLNADLWPGILLPESSEDVSERMTTRQFAETLDKVRNNQSGPSINLEYCNQHQSNPVAHFSNTGMEESGCGRNRVFTILGSRYRTVSGTQFDVLAKPKRAITSSSFLTTQVLLSQVREFPNMLLKERLPQFIYPNCVLGDKRTASCVENEMHTCLPESLAICATVVRLSLTRNRQNSSFITKIILQEQKRLIDDRESYDTAALLAASQASLIYVLLQAQSASSASRDELYFMITCLIDLMARLHDRSLYQADIYSITPLSHRDWALLESTRRVAGLVFVIEIVLGVVFGRRDTAHCPGFSNIPLPCPRSLWDYESRTAWSWRLQRYKQSSLGGSILTLSDLVSASSARTDLETIGREDQAFGQVAEWCQTLDEFGTLIWMAVLLDK